MTADKKSPFPEQTGHTMPFDLEVGAGKTSMMPFLKAQAEKHQSRIVVIEDLPEMPANRKN